MAAGTPFRTRDFGGAVVIASMFIPPEKLMTPPMAESPFSLLPKASNHAAALDSLYLFITLLCVISMVLVIGAQIYFMVKYKKRSDNDVTSPLTHSGKLEFAWSAIPAVFLMVIFFWGERDYMTMASPPGDAIDINVTARKWAWTFNYPEYGSAESIENEIPTLIVPLDVPVRLTMNSQDVIHSLYIPAFRVKKDVVPGRYTSLWFTAIEKGEFPIFCTEYCGDEHSSMLARVVVVGQDEYEARVKAANYNGPKDGESMADFGRRTFNEKGCAACHALETTKIIGPGLKGIWGKTESGGGKSIVVDENYIRESLMSPSAFVVDGYAPQMPPYSGLLNDEQVTGLIELIKSLK
jgi:cytochrome c oxidase subunit 2